MIEAAQLRRGMVVDLDGALYECIDQSLIKMGRGGATVKAKIRNLDSGAQFERSFNSNERLQDIRLENRRVQYLYTDGDLFHFMDLESYEQPVIPRDQIGDAAPFWPAERYHQDYFSQNPAQPYCMGVVAPKVAKFRKQFLDRLKRRTTTG